MPNWAYFPNFVLEESDIENLFLNTETLFQTYRPGCKTVFSEIVGMELKDASVKLEFSFKSPEILCFPNKETAEKYSRKLSRILEMVYSNL